MKLKEAPQFLKKRRIAAGITAVLIFVVGLLFVWSQGFSNKTLYQRAEDYLINPKSDEMAMELNQYRDPTSALEESLQKEFEQKNLEEDSSQDKYDNQIKPEETEPLVSPSPTPESNSETDGSSEVVSPAPSPLPPNPQASDEPTPTTSPSPSPSPSPITTILAELLSDNGLVRNALGEVEIAQFEDEEGNWTYALEGSYENLQPNRDYQLWLCSDDCSTHNSAKFTTDEQGFGTLSGTKIILQNSNLPTLVKVWDTTVPDQTEDETTTCYRTQIDSPACLIGELNW